MKDWSAVFGEDVTHDDSVELGMKSDSESDAPLGIDKSFLIKLCLVLLSVVSP